jgi:hypothetical protein
MGHDADDLEAVQRAGREHIYRTSLYVLRNFAFTSRFNRVACYSSIAPRSPRHLGIGFQFVCVGLGHRQNGAHARRP